MLSPVPPTGDNVTLQWITTANDQQFDDYISLKWFKPVCPLEASVETWETSTTVSVNILAEFKKKNNREEEEYQLIPQMLHKINITEICSCACRAPGPFPGWMLRSPLFFPLVLNIRFQWFSRLSEPCSPHFPFAFLSGFEPPGAAIRTACRLCRSHQK